MNILTELKSKHSGCLRIVQEGDEIQLKDFRSFPDEEWWQELETFPLTKQGYLSAVRLMFDLEIKVLENRSESEVWK